MRYPTASISEHRRLQRPLYDQRRRELIPANGVTLVIASKSQFIVVHRRIRRTPEKDIDIVRDALSAALARWV